MSSTCLYIIYFSLYFDHEMWFLLPYFCQWPPDMILLNQAETPVQMSRLKSHKWNENIISANAKDFESAFYTLRKFVVCVLWSDEKLILFRLFTYSLRRKIIRHSGGRKQNPIFPFLMAIINSSCGSHRGKNLNIIWMLEKVFFASELLISHIKTKYFL